MFTLISSSRKRMPCVNEAHAIALLDQDETLMYPLPLPHAGEPLLGSPPDFEAPIKSMSALVAATVLWLSFTLLELVDVVEDTGPAKGAEIFFVEEGESEYPQRASPVVASVKSAAEPSTRKCEDLCMFFCRTEVEFGFGLALLIEWSVYWRQALYVIFCPVSLSARDLVLLKGSYMVILVGLAALSLQLLVSLALHLFRNGFNAFWEDVWGARTGQWTFRGMVQLDDEEAAWVKEFGMA
ncbi:hypothetical protein JCM24511_10175 [Saitozyma sp. JCM 24511]|nr:hypothetical protein JCM24511_10175 [Saitozyma sp. JCM 24511]